MYVAICSTDTLIRNMLSGEVKQFPRTPRFLAAFGREGSFLLYYTICVQAAQARNYSVLVSA